VVVVDEIARTSPPNAPIRRTNFEAGIPTVLDGEEMDGGNCAATKTIWPVSMAGRIDHVENRLVGIKSREIYEALLLWCASGALQALKI